MHSRFYITFFSFRLGYRSSLQHTKIFAVRFVSKYVQFFDNLGLNLLYHSSAAVQFLLAHLVMLRSRHTLVWLLAQTTGSVAQTILYILQVTRGYIRIRSTRRARSTKYYSIIIQTVINITLILTTTLMMMMTTMVVMIITNNIFRPLLCYTLVMSKTRFSH